MFVPFDVFRRAEFFYSQSFLKFALSVETIVPYGCYCFIFVCDILYSILCVVGTTYKRSRKGSVVDHILRNGQDGTVWGISYPRR